MGFFAPPHPPPSPDYQRAKIHGFLFSISRSWSQDISLASQIFPGREDSFPSFLIRPLKSNSLTVITLPLCP